MFSIQRHQGNQWSYLNMFACCVCGRHVQWPLSLCHRLCVFHHVPILNICVWVCIFTDNAFNCPFLNQKHASVMMKAQDTGRLYSANCFCAITKPFFVRGMMKISRIYLDLSNFAIFYCLLCHAHSFTITLEILLTLNSFSTNHLRIFQMHQCY